MDVRGAALEGDLEDLVEVESDRAPGVSSGRGVRFRDSFRPFRAAS